MSTDERAHLTGVLRRNIRALLEVRRRIEEPRSLPERVAHGMAQLIGSPRFLLLQGVAVALWLLLNATGVVTFDPYPFVMLAMATSVEAIFLSTFVLIAQNRLARTSERRAELDLQISLLSEHEITRILALTDALADHFGLEVGRDDHLEELKRDVKPEVVIAEMDAAEEERDRD